VEHVISMAFFRVPEFRDQFLKIITEKGRHEEVHEWRSSEFPLLFDSSNDFKATSNNVAITHLFDWKTYCYDYASQEDQEKNQEIFQKILSLDDWKSRLQKRGVAFFLIIKNWANNVQKTLVSAKINWKDVPGYRMIIKGILLEMKWRDLIHYPDALIEATNSLLKNENLLNVFVTIVFRKTTPLNTPDTLICLELVTQWILTLEKLDK